MEPLPQKFCCRSYEGSNSSPKISNSSPTWSGDIFSAKITEKKKLHQGRSKNIRSYLDLFQGEDLMKILNSMSREKSGPKYSAIQNIYFMIKLAWKAEEKKILVIGILTVVLTVIQNLLNLYVSPVILEAVEKHVSIRELLFTIGSFVLAIMLVSAVLTYVKENAIYGQITVRMEITNLLNKKAATTSYPNIEDDKFKKLLTKAAVYTDDNSQATEAIWTSLTTLLINTAGFFLYGNLLTQIQPVLLLVILLTCGLSYFIAGRLDQYKYDHCEEEAEYIHHMSYLSNRAADFGAAKDIRIFGLRSWLEELYEKNARAFTAFHSKAEGIYFWAQIADVILTFLRNGVAYGYLIHLVLNRGLSVPDFLLFFSAVDGFSSWITGILEQLRITHRQSLDICVVRECLEYPEAFIFEEGMPLRWEAGKEYVISLEHVYFRYPGACEDALQEINLTLHPGEKLAVVGVNGAGKTTLIKLICGFLDPSKGQVKLNGKDIRMYNRRDYYALFSAVFQDFSLLAATVAQNVAQAETPDMELVKKCVQKAGLTSKIEALPEGYQTWLNREVYKNAIMLSGGETQRLMLARALYKSAPFMILDEPTASLDPVAEAEIYRKYNEMTRGKSSIYISHRLASTWFCDRILMLENGIICEKGTHEELLKLGKKYAGLYEIQSKYYRKGEEKDETEKNR